MLTLCAWVHKLCNREKKGLPGRTKEPLFTGTITIEHVRRNMSMLLCNRFHVFGRLRFIDQYPWEKNMGPVSAGVFFFFLYA